MRMTIAAALALTACTVSSAFAGTAVVTNGKFTNVYVLPDPDKETWEQHLASLRPTDAAKFSRASIDHFSQVLMSTAWPSYFDPLFQYSGINPPLFFGSSVASQHCVDAAMKDMHNGLLEWDTIRSLSNCHNDGMDPSPQVNLIFSPDIKIADIPGTGVGTGSEICTSTNHENAWHAWGINTPNFTALPTSIACMGTFDTFTKAMSHEMVETVSDPAGAGMGTLGQNELADNCENKPDGFTTVSGFALSRYWSNFDNNCQPRLDPPAGSIAETWVLGTGSPLKRFTGDVHELSLNVPARRTITDALATEVTIVVQTGGDDLRGGSHSGDNADVTLNFAGGNTATTNINRGKSWENGQSHAVVLTLPTPAPRVSDITGLNITTHFGGGISGDNWNVNKVALVVSFPAGSVTKAPTPIVIHQWLDASGGPLVRFTGSVHDKVVAVPAEDVGKSVRALHLIISTGNDDLRGGSGAGDNCNVAVELASGKSITLTNVNGGKSWADWSSHDVSIPIPAGGLKGGDVKAVKLHTGFGGGISGDNWNVNRVQLEATMQ